jgi:hypothetical protein
VAVGPDDVMRLDSPPGIAGSVRIFDRTGGAEVRVPIGDFFKFPYGTLYGYAFDPRIIFDALHGRWVAIATQFDCQADHVAQHGRGFMHVAISDTADPRQSWSVFRYEYLNQWVLDPGIGTSTDKFVLTARIENMSLQCGINTQAGWDMTVLEWTDVLGHTTFPEDYFVFEPDPAGTIHHLRPAIQQPATSATVHIVGQASSNADATEHVWHIKATGAVPGAAVTGLDLTAADLVTPYGLPGSGTQGGGAGDLAPAAGPTNAVWRNGRLAVASTETCIPSGDAQLRACARLIELETESGPTVRQDVYFGTNGSSTYAPGVAYSQGGDLHLTYEQSSTSAMPSSFATVQRRADLPGQFSTAVSVLPATDWMNTWFDGKSVQVAADPLDPASVWVAAVAGAGVGGHRVGASKLDTAVGATYNPITPLRVLDTRDGTGLTGRFATNVPRTFDVAGEGTIPTNAIAVTGILTIAGQTGGGYLSVGPTMSANPTSSTINFPLGDTRANNVTLPLDANGDLSAVFKGGPSTTTQLILDVTGYFLADDSGATYEPITAARVLDSRYGTGLSGKFVVNTPRTFQVTGVGGVPAGATAVTGNLTVVGQSKAGYVSLTPTPEPNPLTSTINFPLGDVRANGVTVPLSGTGSLSAVFKASGGSTDLIFDVTGYYVDGTTGLRFYPLNPGRIMDSRFNTLTQLFGQFTSSTPRTLVTGGHFGVPADALAVTGNLTVVGQTKAGYVSITKTPVATPLVSTINFPLGDVRANGVTVPLNAANDMALVYKATSGAKTHLILDLTGFFK